MIWATKSLFNSNKSKQKTWKQEALLKASGLCFTKHPLQTREGASQRPWVGPSYLLTDQEEHQSPPTAPERGGVAALCWDTPTPAGGTVASGPPWSPLSGSCFIAFNDFYKGQKSYLLFAGKPASFFTPLLHSFHESLFYFSLFAFMFFF